MTMNDEVRTSVEQPRINLELLEEVWALIETKALDQALTDGVSIENLMYRTRIDGWDQSNWRDATLTRTGEICGTAMCFAGWTVQLDINQRNIPGDGWLCDPEEFLGRTVSDVFSSEEDGGRFHRMDHLTPREGEEPFNDLGGAPTVLPGVRARTLLGLTDAEAGELFSGGNTFRRVGEIVRKLRYEEITRRMAAEQRKKAAKDAKKQLKALKKAEKAAAEVTPEEPQAMSERYQ